MAIVDDDIERIRSTVSIVDVIGAARAAAQEPAATGSGCVRSTPSGPRRSTCARRPVATSASAATQSGDVFTFVQEIEHVDFVGAVEQLAAKAGIQLTYTTAGHSKERARRKQLVEAMTKAIEWYHDRLLNDPTPARHATTCAAAVSPATSRGTFKIGWAPDDWDALSRGVGHRARPVARQRSGVLEPVATGCRTRSVPGCCSRSSTRTARRSASVAGSCRDRPIRRSTRTRRRRRSTPSRRRCTG